jgi:predicted phosphohydrolase
MARIVFISDTHGYHRELAVPEGDILVHAGDFTMTGRLEEAADFNAFLGCLPHPRKIVIAGNHDFCFQRDPERARALMTSATYLEDESVEAAHIKFYGSPWQPWFCDWAFNLPRGAPLAEKWAMIPDDTDVLVTHGPPRGIGDRTFDGRSEGCDELLSRVKEVRPRFHVFGHIHEAAGTWKIDGTTFINASCLGSPAGPHVVEL